MSLNNLSSRAIIGEYYMALEGVEQASWIDAISMMFESDQESETYRWLGMTPMLREWAEGRQAKGLRDQYFEIAHAHYEATLEIEGKDIRRDKTDQIELRIEDLARRAVQHWNKLATTAIENGTSTDCYDGQYFFDTDHEEGDSGTQSNDLTNSEVAALDVSDTDNPTPDEMADIILGLVNYFYTYVDDQGEPINEDATDFLLMVPQHGTYASSAMQALTGQKLDTGSGGSRDNPVKSLAAMNGGVNVGLVVNPRLSWTSSLAMFRTDARVKPLIRQIEVGTEPELRVLGTDSEHYFKNDTILAGLDCWRAVSYGLWQYAIYGTLS